MEWQRNNGQMQCLASSLIHVSTDVRKDDKNLDSCQQKPVPQDFQSIECSGTFTLFRKSGVHDVDTHDDAGEYGEYNNPRDERWEQEYRQRNVGSEEIDLPEGKEEVWRNANHLKQVERENPEIVLPGDVEDGILTREIACGVFTETDEVERHKGTDGKIDDRHDDHVADVSKQLILHGVIHGGWSEDEPTKKETWDDIDYRACPSLDASSIQCPKEKSAWPILQNCQD